MKVERKKVERCRIKDLKAGIVFEYGGFGRPDVYMVAAVTDGVTLNPHAPYAIVSLRDGSIHGVAGDAAVVPIEGKFVED